VGLVPCGHLRCHCFSVIIYNLDAPHFTTFQSLVFFLVILSKKHAVILTDINLLIIHTELLHDVTAREQLQDLQWRRRMDDEEGHWWLVVEAEQVLRRLVVEAYAA
jgi:hypothetical protein